MVVDTCSEASRQLLATSAALLFITLALVAGTLPTILRAYKRARAFEQNFPIDRQQRSVSDDPRGRDGAPEAGADSPTHPP